MCVVCVSAITAVSLLSPSPAPVDTKSVVSYEFTNKACSRSNVNKVVGNKICLPNGKVYRWAIKKESKAPVAIPTPKPIPVAPEAPKPVVEEYKQPTVNSINVEACKIKEVSNQRGMTGAGFPVWNALTQKTGTVKWALVPVDFKDLRGEENFRVRVDEQMKLLSEWYYTVSEGNLKVEWVVLDKWVTLPGSSSDYIITQSNSPAENAKIAQFWKTAMDESDKQFDYSNIQTVNFLLPKEENIMAASMQGFPWNDAVKNYTTNEGKVSSFTVVGKYFERPGRTYWSYWAHEYGHVIGLPHIGSSYASNPFHSLDLMGSQDGPTRDLSGWLRFIAGWMPDSKVYCQDSSTFKNTDITLVPLNSSDNGVKMAVILLPNSKALIIESRRVSKYSCSTETPWNGVLAYIYDAKLGHGQEFLIPIAPANRKIESSSCGTPGAINTMLNKGDKVTIEGLSIEVLSDGKYNSIRINK